MRIVPITFLVAALSAAPAVSQERSAAKKPPTFPEAIEQAKKAADGEQFGTAISALQPAIRDLQKKQRVAILAGMPKGEGWEIQDDEVNDATDAITAGITMVGMTVQRHYRKGDDKTMSVEVTANSPVLQMLAMMFNNPAM